MDEEELEYYLNCVFGLDHFACDLDDLNQQLYDERGQIDGCYHTRPAPVE